LFGLIIFVCFYQQQQKKKTRKRTENFNKTPTPTPFELEFVEPFKTLNKRKIKNHQFFSNLEISISQKKKKFISSTTTNPPIISINALKYKYTSNPILDNIQFFQTKNSN
jgi:hypothetical protein